MPGKHAGQGPDPLDVQVGLRIRSARKEKGISQSVLASALGMSFQQIQKYEQGTNRVSASVLIKMASTLGVSVADLLGQPAEAAPAAIDLSFLSDPKTVEMALNFSRIPSAEVRERIAELVASLKRTADRPS